MKLLNSKATIRSSAVAFSLALGLSLCVPPLAVAADRGGRGSKPELAQSAEFVAEIEGSFDGLDLKEKRIWISDMVYLLDRAVKVKGTHKKLGLITDLKQGELIKATLRENDKTPEIPYVILIERQ